MSFVTLLYSVFVYIRTLFASFFLQQQQTQQQQNSNNNTTTTDSPVSSSPPEITISISNVEKPKALKLNLNAVPSLAIPPVAVPAVTPRTRFRQHYEIPQHVKPVLPAQYSSNKDTLAHFYEQNSSLQVRAEGASYFSLCWEPEPDAASNILYNEALADATSDPQHFHAPYLTVKSATPNKVIEKLMNKSLKDESYTDLLEVFFATYTSFLSPDQLLEKLGTLAVLNATNKDELASLFGLFQYWLEHYFYDLSNDTICRLIKFLNTVEALSSHALQFAEKLRNIVHVKIFETDNWKVPTSYPLALDWEQRRQEAEERLAKEAEEGGEDTVEEEEQQNEEQDAPAEDGEEPQEDDAQNNDNDDDAAENNAANSLEPIIPIGWDESMPIDLLTWDTVEIARQICIMELELLKHIQPSELLNNNYTAANMDKKALNVAVMIHRFNLLSKWASRTILEQKNMEKRAETIKYMLDLVVALIGITNFNASMAIYGSLNQQPIFRLKATWELVDAEHNELFEQFHTLFSPNKKFKNMKDALDVQQPPSIPYIGVFLGDLSTVDSVTKDHSGALVNFNKKRVCTKIIRHLQMFQKHEYKYKPIHALQEFFKNDICKNVWNDDDEYETSYKLEPKK